MRQLMISVNADFVMFGRLYILIGWIRYSAFSPHADIFVGTVIVEYDYRKIYTVKNALKKRIIKRDLSSRD